MIDINLVPSHLRKRRKSRYFLGKVNIPLEVIIGCGGGLLVLLGMVHVLLLFVNVRKLAQHKNFQKQWEAMRPEKENVDAVINEMRALHGRYTAIQDIVEKEGVSWAQKLNILSDSLPRGVWLKKIALNGNMMSIEGSAISRETSEIIGVHRLISNLKGNKDFLKAFTDFELGSIQMRRIKNVEIADFVITVKLE